MAGTHPTEDQKRRYAGDGAVKAQGLLDPDQVAQARACYDWAIANPGPHALILYPGTPRAHHCDVRNPALWKTGGLKALVHELPFADYLAELWGSEHVWYLAEELFAKEGGTVANTPWHQDSSYIPLRGSHWANVWISFESLPARNALSMVRGSHRGTRYNGIVHDRLPEPLYPDSDLPRLPDVEADLARDPASWDMIAWDTEPGDVILAHPGALHGGAPVDAVTPDRHTLVLRFFGDDATYDPLPGVDLPWMDDQAEGAPFRSDIYPQLR